MNLQAFELRYYKFMSGSIKSFLVSQKFLYTIWSYSGEFLRAPKCFLLQLFRRNWWTLIIRCWEAIANFLTADDILNISFLFQCPDLVSLSPKNYYHVRLGSIYDERREITEEACCVKKKLFLFSDNPSLFSVLVPKYTRILSIRCCSIVSRFDLFSSWQ